MAARVESWVGLQLSDGRYDIQSLLGEGGMGFVYRVQDRNLDTDVVIKVPRRAMLDDPDFAHRFTREIRALVQLVHPHIVKISDAGEYEGLPYAVMQCLPGGSLEDRRVLERDGRARPMPATSLADWLPVIAKALDFVHSKGIVHRDVKPGNILFDQHGNAYLSDFGIAKVLATASEQVHTSPMTSAGNVVGTPEYMALELIMGHPYDGRADQYALAVTVYELLAGRRPFEETGTAVMVRLGQAQGPPELHVLCPNVPVGLSRAIHRGLAKDPASRYPTCTDFATAVLGQVRAFAPTQKMAEGAGATADGRAVLACPSCGGRMAVPEVARGRRGRCAACGTRYRVADDLSALELISETAAPAGTVLMQNLGTAPTGSAPSEAPRPKRTDTVLVGGPVRTQVELPARDASGQPETGGDAPVPDQSRRMLWIGSAIGAGVLGMAAVVGAILLRPGADSSASSAEVRLKSLRSRTPPRPPTRHPEERPVPRLQSRTRAGPGR